MNLLRIFYANGSFFTFLVLEVVCLYLVVNFNEPQRAIAAETWSVRSGSVRDVWSGVQDYLDLPEENRGYQREIARLRSLLPQRGYAVAADRDSVVDPTYRQRYTYLPAVVVNRSPYGPNNTVVIDRGEALGVEPGQGVVGRRGLVGVVDRTTENHARLISVLHQAARVSAGLRNNAFGTLAWDGRDPRFMTLSDVADYVTVVAGDTVFTTGFSNVYPTGLPIGTVASTAVQPGTGTQDIRVRLLGEPLEARDAYVVQDVFKEELSVLQTDD